MTEQQVNQMLANNEIWQRLNLHKTNEETYKEELKKATIRCKNSATINKFIKDVQDAAISSNIANPRINIMLKELCSELITLTYLYPQATDQEIITNICQSLKDKE